MRYSADCGRQNFRTLATPRPTVCASVRVRAGEAPLQFETPQKALARGVPVVAVPFGRDQFEVARRVEVASAGLRLPAAKLTPAALRDAVQRARTMRDGAARVAAGYAQAGGPIAAAEAVERRLLSPTRPAPRAVAQSAAQRPD